MMAIGNSGAYGKGKRRARTQSSERIKRVAGDNPALLFIPHTYVSTACQHLQHEECRKDCKFCQTVCICPCHWEKAVLQALTERAKH